MKPAFHPTTPTSFDASSLILRICIASAFVVFADGACPPRHWHSSLLDACVPCTGCAVDTDRPIVLRPCQPHQDTVCGTLNDLEFEWTLLQQHSHQQHHGNNAASPIDAIAASATDAAATSWDWQPASMAFAAVACVLFVLALVFILYQHAKQWRHMENMERRFDRGECDGGGVFRRNRLLCLCARVCAGACERNCLCLCTGKSASNVE